MPLARGARMPDRSGTATASVDFQPFHVKTARTELGLLGNRTHQCSGRFTGRVRSDEGEWIDLDGLTGWAEEVHNRW